MEGMGMRIAYIIDTHTHTDHLSGKVKLSKRLGTRI